MIVVAAGATVLTCLAPGGVRVAPTDRTAWWVAAVASVLSLVPWAVALQQAVTG